MKKLLLVFLPLLLVFVGLAAVAEAGVSYGTQYTVGGLGDSVVTYYPSVTTRSVQIHLDSEIPLLKFKVNGVSYLASCKQYPAFSYWACESPRLAVTSPMFVEIGVGYVWWLDFNEYYSRYTATLPEIHRCCFTQPPPGTTSTPVPTEVGHPFDARDPQQTPDPTKFVVATVTPEP